MVTTRPTRRYMTVILFTVILDKYKSIIHYNNTSWFLLNIKRKIWTWTGTQTRTSRSPAWRSTIELSWFSCQFAFKLSSWNNYHIWSVMWSMTLPVIYWSLSELTSLLNKCDIQIKLLVKANLIICAFVHLHYSISY